MARIRSGNTTPEKMLRAALWARGLRYRLQFKTPGGRPDIAFPSKDLAIFVDGCFWHGCPDHYTYPRSRREFWSQKLSTNVERDRRQTQELEAAGWTVLRFWEHEVYEELPRVVEAVETALSGSYRPGPRWRVEAVEVVDVEVDLERRHLVTLAEPASRRVEVRARSTRKALPPSAIS